MNYGHFDIDNDNDVFNVFVDKLEDLVFDVGIELNELKNILPDIYGLQLLFKLRDNTIFKISDIALAFEQLKSKNKIKINFIPLFKRIIEFYMDSSTKYANINKLFINNLITILKSTKINIDNFQIILPDHMKTNNKKIYLQTFNDNNMISLENIMHFFRNKDIVQTTNKEYQLYPLFVKYYNLKSDKYYRIIFTDGFSFNSSIKKENYFTYWDNEILENHTFISRYKRNLKFGTQYKLETAFYSENSLCTDIIRPGLCETTEIDETDKTNDPNSINKNSFAKLIGLSTNRLEFHKIHSGTIISNINDIYAKHPYSIEYYNKRIDLAIGALITNGNTFDEYIWYLLGNLINEENTEIYDFIKEMNAEILKFEELDADSNKITDPYYLELKEDIAEKMNTINENNKILKTMKEDPIIKLLKECKASSLNLSKDKILSKDNDTLNKKNIPFSKILLILGVDLDDSEEIILVKKCLSKIGCIKNKFVKDKDINISWSSLSDVLAKYSIDATTQKVLKKNYKFLDIIYILGIDKLKRYYENKQPTSYDLNNFTKRYEQKIKTQIEKKYQTIIKNNKTAHEKVLKQKDNAYKFLVTMLGHHINYNRNPDAESLPETSMPLPDLHSEDNSDTVSDIDDGFLPLNDESSDILNELSNSLDELL
jgi:hypothetical protein